MSRRFAVLIFAILIPAAATAQRVVDPVSAKLVYTSEVGDVFGLGDGVTRTHEFPSYAFDVGALVFSTAGSVPDYIDIIYERTSDALPHPSGRIGFIVPNNQLFSPGTYTVQRSIASFNQNFGGAAVNVSGNTGCRGEAIPGGSFTVNEASYEAVPVAGTQFTSFHLLLLDMSFDLRCGNAPGRFRGTFRIVDDPLPGGEPVDPGDGGNGDDGGGDGDDDTPPHPPPPFQVVLPPELAIDPLIMGNNGSQTVHFTTAIDSTFSSDVQLSVVSTASEFEDFHVSLSPALIPAPGAGEAAITVRTGPLTFPGMYTVSVFATAGDAITGSSFRVLVDCTPPFILGIDQPTGVSAIDGTQTTLEVKAGGSGPLLYQWYRGQRGMTGDPVQSEHNAKLTLTARETGLYWVRVRNACGSVDSNAALVTVTPQPTAKTFMRRSSRGG